MMRCAYPAYKPSDVEWLPSMRGLRHPLNARVADAVISACFIATTSCDAMLRHLVDRKATG